MDNVTETIVESYLKVKAGARCVDIETAEGVTIRAYRAGAGAVIRIDIKDGEEIN